MRTTLVRGCGEGHDPIHPLAAAMPQLPQPADRFHPSKHLFDQLPCSLTDLIAGVPRRAPVDRPILRLGRDVGG